MLLFFTVPIHYLIKFIIFVCVNRYITAEGTNLQKKSVFPYVVLDS